MWINYLLAALTGVLYIVSCAPIDQFYLMWFAFIPLFFAIRRTPKASRSHWRLFRLGLTSAFFMGATGYYWLIHATQNYGGIPLPVSIIIYIAFCFTNQLQVPLYVLLRERLRASTLLKQHVILCAFVLGVCYVGLDSFVPKIFSDTVGSAFYHSSWVRQLADIGGPMLITFFGITINEILFQAIADKKLKLMIAPLVLAILICGYGIYRNDEYRKLKTAHSTDPVFRASLIQGNIGDFMKVAAEHGEQNAVTNVMGEYLRLSEEALKAPNPPDALIWPETAYPAIYSRPFTDIEARMQSMLDGLLKVTHGYIIFGGYDNDIRGREYNSIFFLKSGNPIQKDVYHKSTLLMFGETLPFSEEFPAMKSYFPTMGFFGRGSGPEVDVVKNAKGDSFKLAPSICYEGLFTDFAVEGALLGADALLNVTNDSWFGEHGEPYQHLSLTRFRSIETRLPMIRATNTGLTVWIDPTGEQIKSTEISKSEILETEIQHRFFPDSPYMTVAKVFGPNWFVRLFQLLTIGAFFCFGYRKRKSRVRD